MESRIKEVLEDLIELNTVKDGRIVVDIKLDDSSSIFGLSLKAEIESGKKEEIVWIEGVENAEISVEVNPDVEERAEYSQDLWAVLYCVSANLKSKEEDVWGDLEISEIAEEIYESRQSKIDVTEELESNMGVLEEVSGDKEVEGLYKIPVEELPEEITLTIGLDALMEIIMEYDDKDAVVVVDFINLLAEINDIDLQIGVSKLDADTGEETEPEFRIDKSSENVDENTAGGRVEQGLLEQDYVIMNTSALIEHFIIREEDNKDVITFLNQLIFERVQVEKLINAVFPEEE